MIRTCLFDMGNVLLHFSHEKMCAQIGALCGLSELEMRALLLDSGTQLDFERGRMSEPEFHRWLVAKVAMDMEIDALRVAASDIFVLNEPMLPILDHLKALGIRLVLLSNTSVSHFEFIRERFDVLDRFDDFVVSFRAGAVKPEPPIYEAALRAIHCEPAECFYTDDIPLYVETGRTFGLEAEVFSDAAALKGHLRDRGIDLES
ncbi:MAG: HAD family phosphatase [Planctomycetaceae bacterium]|nr:HAD family phosphatase [Planctomycetaceae bacterium]